MAFERLLDDAKAARSRNEPSTAAETAQQALALVRGEPYGDLADVQWLRPEVERLAS